MSESAAGSDDAADSDVPLDQRSSLVLPAVGHATHLEDALFVRVDETLGAADAQPGDVVCVGERIFRRLRDPRPDAEFTLPRGADVAIGGATRLGGAGVFVRLDERRRAADARPGDVVRRGAYLYRRLHEYRDDAVLRQAARLRGYEMRPLHERVLGSRSPAGAWSPRWALDYQMPRAALTHHFDVQRLFAARLDETQAAAATPRKKGGTLRRLRKARAATDERAARLELSKQQIGALNDETERIVLELTERVEVFSALLCHAVGVRDAERVVSVGTLASLFLVDRTVTQHPNLKALGMPDNRLLLEAARGALWTFACAAAVEARYRLVDAERRRDTVLRTLGVWLQREFGSEAGSGAVPVSWNLSEDTHEPLPTDAVVARHNNRLLRETPLLMLGVLLQLEWHAEADALLRRWWRDCL